MEFASDVNATKKKTQQERKTAENSSIAWLPTFGRDAKREKQEITSDTHSEPAASIVWIMMATV